MSIGYSVEELAELLGAKIYSQIDTEVTVNDFEYAPLPLKRNEKKVYVLFRFQIEGGQTSTEKN